MRNKKNILIVGKKEPNLKEYKMPLLFNESPSYLLTSESVTEGHPDKLCDQISDAVIDAVMTDDPMGRVACETAMTNGLVMVIGEITTKANLNIPEIVRETLRKAGYTRATPRRSKKLRVPPRQYHSIGE